MSEPVVLRTVKMGGFNKEDVLQYVDELNSKNVALEDQVKALKDAGPSDPKEIQRYREQLDNMQKKLNESNNALRAAKAENDELKKQLAGGKAAPADAHVAAPAVNTEELAKLKDALGKSRTEIDRLTHALAQAQAQAAAKPAAVAAPAHAPAPVDMSAKDAEIAKISSQLTATANELKSKIEDLSTKEKELADKVKLIGDKDKAISAKDAEISELTEQIGELKENEGAGIPSSFDMGALFTEAQKTARKITIEAKVSADKMTKDSKDQARAILDEANAEAKKTIDSAGLIAETHIKEAKEKARADFYESYKRAESLNAASDTVKEMLVNEIESVSIKLNDVSSLIEKVTNQASVRLNDAKGIVEEARKVISSKKKVDIGDFDSSAPSFSESSASAPVSKPEPSKTMSFDEIPVDFSFPSHKTENRPAQKPENSTKNVSNFSFDMSELLKAAEEEAFKEEQA